MQNLQLIVAGWPNSYTHGWGGCSKRKLLLNTFFGC